MLEPWMREPAYDYVSMQDDSFSLNDRPYIIEIRHRVVNGKREWRIWQQYQDQPEPGDLDGWEEF